MLSNYQYNVLPLLDYITIMIGTLQALHPNRTELTLGDINIYACITHRARATFEGVGRCQRYTFKAKIKVG